MSKLRTEQKLNVKNSVSRFFTVALFVFAQFTYLFFVLYNINARSLTINLIIHLIAVFFAVYISGRNMNTSMKMSWILLVLAFPLFGIFMYIISVHNILRGRLIKRYRTIDKSIYPLLNQEKETFDSVKKKSLSLANISDYLWRYNSYPVYANTDVKFFSDSFEGLKAQMEDLKNAKEFIFMEYFSVEAAPFFEELMNILSQKAREGVVVKFFYDDVGSMKFVDMKFMKQMNERGINTRIFNQVGIFFHLFMQHRDHRKITVIDGKIAYTGGYNLASEYFNFVSPYGHWKDTGIRIEGPAVDSLTVTFFENWFAADKKNLVDEDITKYLNKSQGVNCPGFVQPFGDTPLDYEHTGENVILNIVNRAKKYVYFTTPYLIITDELNRAMGLAAKRGVDVRIITPKIPDKKIVFQITKSYYPALLNRNVKIYEYTPGFIHAKQCVSDDDIAIVGSINLDYRSFYHHFEDSVCFFGENVQAIGDIKADFDRILEVSHRVSAKEAKLDKMSVRAVRCFLRLIATLM